VFGKSNSGKARDIGVEFKDIDCFLVENVGDNGVLRAERDVRSDCEGDRG